MFKKLWKLYYSRQLNKWFKRNFDSPSPEFIKHRVLNRFNIENLLGLKQVHTMEIQRNIYLNLQERLLQ